MVSKILKARGEKAPEKDDTDRDLEWFANVDKTARNHDRDSNMYSEFWEIIEHKIDLKRRSEQAKSDARAANLKLSSKKAKVAHETVAHEVFLSTPVCIIPHVYPLPAIIYPFILSLFRQAKESDPLFLVHPLNKWKVRWDLMVGIFVLYTVVVVPYRVGFPSSKKSEGEYVVDCVFALDLFLNLNTAYLDIREETYEFDRWKILKNYFKFWFWVDFVSIVPIDEIIAILPVRTMTILYDCMTV